MIHVPSTCHDHKRSVNQRRQRHTTYLFLFLMSRYSLSFLHAFLYSLTALSLSLCGNKTGAHKGLPLCSFTAPSLSMWQRRQRRGGDGPYTVEGSWVQWRLARSDEGQRWSRRWGRYSLFISLYLSLFISLTLPSPLLQIWCQLEPHELDDSGERNPRNQHKRGRLRWQVGGR